MGQKEQIAGNYIDEMKQKHLQNPNPPSSRRSLILGWEKGNIGDAINLALQEARHNVFAAGQHSCNAANEIDVEQMLFGTKPDTLVLTNGYSHLDWIEDISPSQVFRTVESNLTASIIATHAFVKKTIDLPYKKHIVFIGSMAYRSVLNASAAYCASKAGLAHFAKCVAWELAPKNYDVFIVHPSNTEGTPMTEETIKGIMRYRNISRAEAEAYWSAVLPRQDWLQPEDIGRTVAWLVSGQASYLSGSPIEMAGGQR